MENEVKSTKKTTKQIGDELAQEHGAKSASAYTESLRQDVKSASTAKSTSAKTAALDFTQKLLRLVLYQEIKSEFNLTKYKWIDRFDDERIEAGDGKEYIKNLLTGVDEYKDDVFVPSAATNPSADAKVIRLYDSTGAINKYGFKALKPLTITESKWFPYFMSGKLMQFIDEQVDIMKKSMFFYKYTIFSKLFKELIKDSGTENISKRITGKATNILTAFVNEIFPEIENMQYFNKEFARDNRKNTEYPNVNNREDLLMIMNRKTLNRFKNGAMSNELNSKLINFNDVLPLENIIGTGADIKVGASTENITVLDTELVEEDTVVVINKNLLKYLWFVEISDSQKFVQNMSIQFVHHLWGVFGQLDWEGAFVYKNPNLKTLPITVR